MDGLVPVVRGGEVYHCYVQAIDILFPNLPKSTVRSWMKELNIVCEACSPDERSFLKVMLPNLSGAFRIIKVSELKKIVALKESKVTKNTLRYATKDGKGTLTPAIIIQITQPRLLLTANN